MERVIFLRRALGVAVGFILLNLNAPLSAQYFGQNKVQFKKLDFQVLKTEHFDIYFYPQEREGVAIAARMAERWHARLERLFEHTLRGRLPVIALLCYPFIRIDGWIAPPFSIGCLRWPTPREAGFCCCSTATS